MEIKNLTELRKKLPREVFQISYIKNFYYIFRDLFLFSFFSYLIYRTNEIYFLIPLWFFHALSILALFQLGHDLAHGALFRNKKISYILGQICFLPTLHPYHQWVFGHNQIHHGNTSKLKFDLAWHPRTLDRYNKMNKMDKFFHKIYWSWYGTGIYYLNKMWLQGLILNPAPNKKAKFDIFLNIIFAIFVSLLLFYLVHFEFYKFIWYFFKLLFFPFLIWNYTIGIIVYMHHINEKIIWKKEDSWTPIFGQVFGTTVYQVPNWVNFFLHNILIHIPHHVHTKIPFYHLPKAYSEIKKYFVVGIYESKNFWKDYFYTTSKCKLIDTEKNYWVNFKTENKKNLF